MQANTPVYTDAYSGVKYMDASHKTLPQCKLEPCNFHINVILCAFVISHVHQLIDMRRLNKIKEE